MSCATVRCSVWTTDKCRSHLRLVKCSLVTSGLLARKLKHDLRLKIDDNIVTVIVINMMMVMMNNDDGDDTNLARGGTR